MVEQEDDSLGPVELFFKEDEQEKGFKKQQIMQF